MDEKDDDVAHWAIVARTADARKCCRGNINLEFAKHRLLPLDEALGICRQITEGREAAHKKGVIHRDLKPANVMITEGDKVKILDFGLSKALSGETQSATASQSPTITEAMTQPGVILGTAAYISPEQAKDKSVDGRADIAVMSSSPVL